MSNKNPLPVPRRFPQALKYFLAIVFPLIFLIGGITALIYFFEVRTERVAIETYGISYIGSVSDVVVEEFEEAIADLKVFARHQEERKFLEKADLENLSLEALEFSKAKGLYDQMRFLDETGMEIIRINYNNGAPELVRDEDLQTKGQRYYFQEAIVLNKGEVYVSPFDLNVEHGEIEQPLKPMIRFATPIFDEVGNKRGVAVVNYFGEYLLKVLARGDSSSRIETMLLNKDGFWLKGMKTEDEWGFMYEDKQSRTFETDYSDEWERVSGEESGQFYTKNGLFIFETVYPLESMGRSDYYWKMVGYTPANVLNEKPRQQLQWILLIDGLLVAVVAGGGWILARSISQRKSAEKKVFELKERLGSKQK